MKRFQIVLKILASVFATLLTSCAYTPKAQFVETNSAEGTFVDTRDGQTYKTVTIGTQTWMAENLKYAIDGSYCYDNDETKCEKYGRLYSWSSALDDKLCPSGWHLPFFEEWEILSDAVGGRDVASQKLRSSKGWGNEYNGDDNYSFSVRPSGFRHPSGYSHKKGEFEGMKTKAYFWLNGDFSLSRILPYAGEHRLGDFVKREFGEIGECVEYADAHGRRIAANQLARGVLMFEQKDSEIGFIKWGVKDVVIKIDGKEWTPIDFADDYWLPVRCISDAQAVSESEED